MLPRGQEGASDAGERSADCEGLQLGDRRVDSHHVRRELVLADRLPGPTDPRVAQPRRGEEGEAERGEEKVVVFAVARRDEPGEGGRVDRDETARPAGDVDRPVEIYEKEIGDLAEAERDDRQVVTAQPQG